MAGSIYQWSKRLSNRTLGWFTGWIYFWAGVITVTAVAVTVPLAFWFRDYRALICGMLLSAVAGCLMSYAVHPHRPRWNLQEAGGLFRLPRNLPPKIAMEVVLTGDPIPAERAHMHGLVNELVEPGQALEAALALAERICANAPLAVRASREVLLAAQTEDDDTLWKMSAAAMGKLASTEDFAEGPRAFIEKRPPQWKGR